MVPSKMMIRSDPERNLYRFDQTGSEQFLEPEVRKCNYFMIGKFVETVHRVIFSFFYIASPDGGRGRWSLISGSGRTWYFSDPLSSSLKFSEDIHGLHFAWPKLGRPIIPTLLPARKDLELVYNTKLKMIMKYTDLLPEQNSHWAGL